MNNSPRLLLILGLAFAASCLCSVAADAAKIAALPPPGKLELGGALAQSTAGKVVFDNDLTRGPSAFTGKAKGGEWKNGWWFTGKAPERLVWDAGYPIKNGYFEFWLTLDTPPFSPVFFKVDKQDRPDLHWAGMSGVPEIAMERHAFALRLGEIKLGEGKGHGWSKIVVLGPKNVVDTEKTEIPIGNFADWLPLCDGWQVVHMRIEWKNGVGALYRMNGDRKECPPSTGGRKPVHITDLRYAWIGGADDEQRFSFKGQRFLRARLVDLEHPGRVEPITMPALMRE